MTNEEINKEIAEKIMRWFDNDGLWFQQINKFTIKYIGHKSILPTFGNAPEYFNPTENISDAFEVVEKMKGNYYVVMESSDSEWDVTFFKKDNKEYFQIIDGESLSKAICLAALSVCKISIYV